MGSKGEMRNKIDLYFRSCRIRESGEAVIFILDLLIWCVFETFVVLHGLYFVFLYCFCQWNQTLHPICIVRCTDMALRRKDSSEIDRDLEESSARVKIPAWMRFVKRGTDQSLGVTERNITGRGKGHQRHDHREVGVELKCAGLEEQPKKLVMVFEGLSWTINGCKA